MRRQGACCCVAKPGALICDPLDVWITESAINIAQPAEDLGHRLEVVQLDLTADIRLHGVDIAQVAAQPLAVGGAVILGLLAGVVVEVLHDRSHRQQAGVVVDHPPAGGHDR